MREIIFDTETTGLSPAGGDRMVEIGCVEMINRVETGRVYHAYFNPERTMPSEAEAVHGLGDTFLSDKPMFGDTVSELLEFVGDAPLIAHNATFDFGFLNAELQRCSRDPVCLSRMICTLVLARSRHPGAKHSLDALCTRFGVDRSHRVKHGALLDAQLLAQVYVELTGGRQIGLTLIDDSADLGGSSTNPLAPERRFRAPRPHFATDSERERHRRFIVALANPLWERFLAPTSGDVPASM
ncbi:MAG: DNA polymerase III subunit epsilon [Sphingomicrobium sp.]